MSKDLIRYGELLTAVKTRIRQAQVKATLSANAEMILMYWDVGRMLQERQEREGWGASVIPRLAKDIRNELPEVKGFSERNISRMIAFYKEYQDLSKILPQPVAKINGNDKLGNAQLLVVQIPWGHNILLMEKIKDLSTRFWYMQQTIENGWSHDMLGLMIKNNAHERQGMAITNITHRLPDPQSDLAQQALKDPYIFDFLTLAEPFQERELETGWSATLKNFCLNWERDLPLSDGSIIYLHFKSPKSEVADIPDNTDGSFIPMAQINEFSGTINVSLVRKIGEVRKGYTFFAENDCCTTLALSGHGASITST